MADQKLLSVKRRIERNICHIRDAEWLLTELEAAERYNHLAVAVDKLSSACKALERAAVLQGVGFLFLTVGMVLVLLARG